MEIKWTREDLEAMAAIISNAPMQGTIASGLSEATQQVRQILGKIQGALHQLNVAEQTEKQPQE